MIFNLGLTMIRNEGNTDLVALIECEQGYTDKDMDFSVLSSRLCAANFRGLNTTVAWIERVPLRSGSHSVRNANPVL